MACVLTFFIAAVAGVVAVALFGLRDFYENRAREEARPLEDRIRDYKDGAAGMIEGLERHATRPDLQGKRPLLPPIIDFYRRLEELAATTSSTPEEAMRLDAEALQYAREHRLKGVFVMNEPKRLASLLKKRKSGGDANSATSC